MISSPSGAIARSDLSVVRRLLPYLWEFRGRVILAVIFLVAAKLANITVPIVMKRIVDTLTPPLAIAAVLVALLVAYAVLRLSSSDGDLLAIGTSPVGGIARVFLGSRGSKILRHSPVPVLVLPG